MAKRNTTGKAAKQRAAKRAVTKKSKPQTVDSTPFIEQKLDFVREPCVIVIKDWSLD